jgi:hypothetical protein
MSRSEPRMDFSRSAGLVTGDEPAFREMLYTDLPNRDVWLPLAPARDGLSQIDARAVARRAQRARGESECLL